MGCSFALIYVHQYQQSEQSPLNSDGHQFHQYQQSEPLILIELVEHKKTTTYDVGNPGPGLGLKAQK
jgi:hypothetical protein